MSRRSRNRPDKRAQAYDLARADREGDTLPPDESEPLVLLSGARIDARAPWPSLARLGDPFARSEAMKHHPDRGGDAAKFQQAQQAYDVLGEEDKLANAALAIVALYEEEADPEPPPAMFGQTHRFMTRPDGWR